MTVARTFVARGPEVRGGAYLIRREERNPRETALQHLACLHSLRSKPQRQGRAGAKCAVTVKSKGVQRLAVTPAARRPSPVQLLQVRKRLALPLAS